MKVETTLRLGCAGMGDVLTLVEKAEASIKEEDAAEITKRMLSAKFDFNDFLKQYKMVSGMGSMGQIMKMLPGESAVSFCASVCMHFNFLELAFEWADESWAKKLQLPVARCLKCYLMLLCCGWGHLLDLLIAPI